MYLSRAWLYNNLEENQRVLDTMTKKEMDSGFEIERERDREKYGEQKKN